MNICRFCLEVEESLTERVCAFKTISKAGICMLCG
jgi:hypothetical protein